MDLEARAEVINSKEGLQSKRAAWFGLLEEYEREGVKRKAFCASRGLNRDHFNYYYGQYRRSKANKGCQGFMPVSVLPTDGHWVIHCDSSVRVEVPSGVSVAVLLELLKGLREL